jgi:succinoglycan biosynthesis transport protein ExoP
MDAEIDLRAIFSFIKRQIQLVIVVFIAVLGLTAIYVFTLTPIYTATTLVMVDPSNKNLLLDQTQMGTSSTTDARIEGEVLLAESDNVLLTVIDREDLVNNPEFQAELGFTARILSFLRLREPTLPTPDQALRQTLAKLDSMVNVQRHRATFLVSISASSKDPDTAAKLANAVAKAYIDTQLSAKVQSTLDARDVLLVQVDTARQRVIETDGSFDRYIETNLGAIIEQTNNAELANIQSQIGELSTLRQSTSQDVATLQTALAQQDFTALSARLADEAIANLEQQRQSILGELTEGSSSSELDLRARLESIETELQQRANEQISGLQSELQDTQANETALRQSLRSAILTSGLPPDTLTEIYDMQQRADLARQQYDQLVTRSQQLQAEATLQLPDSRVVSPALRPANPSFPSTRTILVLAAAFGLALGVGIAFVYERFIGGVTSEEQLASIAKAKATVAVPRIKLQAERSSVADTLVSSPLSVFSESIRRVRAAIDQVLMSNREIADRAPVIMVTSTLPGEGKTSLSLSIARSYALSGRKTLLIDCDLRRPSVHRQLNVESSDGLIDALKSNDPVSKLSEAMIEEQDTGLLTLVGSRNSSAATDQLVTSRNFENLITAATKSFDVVILDTPPLGPVVDGLYIAQKSDAVVMVVQWAATAQQDLRRALTAMDGILDGQKPVVPVLNQVNISSSPYHRRYQSYYTAEEA